MHRQQDCKVTGASGLRFFRRRLALPFPAKLVLPSFTSSANYLVDFFDLVQIGLPQLKFIHRVSAFWTQQHLVGTYFQSALFAARLSYNEIRASASMVCGRQMDSGAKTDGLASWE